jgi:uncharacterized protein (DUF302 family)
MYYIVESNKSFEQAAIDLEAAVKRNDFGLLHIHDLGVTLRSKGIAFAENCKVFEVCNPGQANKVLSTDMRLYTEQGKTMIGMIKPVPMLAALSQDTSLVKVAQEVEAQTRKMMDEAK